MQGQATPAVQQAQLANKLDLSVNITLKPTDRSAQSRFYRFFRDLNKNSTTTATPVAQFIAAQYFAGKIIATTPHSIAKSLQPADSKTRNGEGASKI
jgi:hypothetical protein